MFYQKAVFNSFLICLVFALASCSKHKPEPEIASSASLSGYAIDYPSELQELTERYDQRALKASEIFTLFPSFTDELADPDWAQVLDVHERADEAGRSRVYVEQMQETDYISAFIKEEKDEITRRIVGAVKSQEKKAECPCEIEAHAKVPFAFKDSVNKQIEKRAKRHSDAHRLIERYKITLKKKNSKILKKQADTITEASYIVFVELSVLWAEIDRRVAEARRVRRTLEDAIEAEQLFVDHPETPKAEKKASEKRIAELKEAKDSIDAIVAAASELVSEGETEIPKIRQEYEEAFDMLCNTISDKASGSM
ncbi:MAG: hypothetical protein GY847_10815 [Proteobacteria bacterium]|nr:hypothetical protein [Pseudomonadota bacterium]